MEDTLLHVLPFVSYLLSFAHLHSPDTINRLHLQLIIIPLPFPRERSRAEQTKY